MLSSDLLALGIQVNVTACLVAKPGVGKTAVTRQIAKALQEKIYGGKPYPFIVTNAAQAMPEDIGGAQVPNHESKTMDSYAMGSIKEFIQHGRGVHLIDEYGSSSPAMRAALLSVNEGRIYGDRHLPGVSVVLCMNPPECAVNGADMAPPESNRPFWIDFELENSAYWNYMLGGSGAVESFPILPADWEDKHLPKAKSLVVSFLKRNPMLIHKMPPPEKATGPWPSNRSWELAAKMFAATRACGYELHSDHVYAAIKGCIGRDVAEVFFAWVKDMDLPDPEEILSAAVDKAEKMIPEKKDRAIVCLESVAAAATERSHKDAVKRWEKAWDILTPIAQLHEDYVEPAARILAKNQPAGAKIPALAGQILKTRRDMGISKSGITS